MEAALPADFYNRKFDRMDADLVKALRDSVSSDVPSWGIDSAADPEEYSPVGTNRPFKSFLCDDETSIRKG